MDGGVGNSALSFYTYYELLDQCSGRQVDRQLDRYCRCLFYGCGEYNVYYLLIRIIGDGVVAAAAVASAIAELATVAVAACLCDSKLR